MGFNVGNMANRLRLPSHATVQEGRGSGFRAIEKGACEVRPGIWSCPPEAFTEGKGERDCLRLMAKPTEQLKEESDCYKEREIQGNNGQSEVASTLSGMIIRQAKKPMCARRRQVLGSREDTVKG